MGPLPSIPDGFLTTLFVLATLGVLSTLAWFVYGGLKLVGVL